MSEIRINQPLPVGAIDTRTNGWWAMLWLIATEAALFAYLLFSYYYIAVQPHMSNTFPIEGPPALKLAAPDTAILILSSICVAFGQHGIMHGKIGRLVAGIFLGMVLGIVFIAIQYKEWMDKPFPFSANPYSSLYFTVTGFHMAHVAVGVIALFGVFLWSAMGYFNGTRYAHVHIVAAYWHFVDVVWIAIFFTFYITPRIAS